MEMGEGRRRETNVCWCSLSTGGAGLVLTPPRKGSITHLLQMSGRGSAPRNLSLICCYNGVEGTDHSTSFYQSAQVARVRCRAAFLWEMRAGWLTRIPSSVWAAGKLGS